MTHPTDDERALAQRVLRHALDDLRLESMKAGRIQLFEALYTALLDPESGIRGVSAGAHSDSEIRLALTRLRERLRERVNARLREEEPDAERRRSLRRRLQATRNEAGEQA
jgi:hypothetical protein